MTTVIKNYWLLLIIILASILVRVWLLGSLPSILNRDEAALGYNAFLLQQTGYDEWNKSWPWALESFGDYKLPGYPLLLVGLFTLASPSDFVVRLPSMVAGVGIVILAYALARKFGWPYIYSCIFALVIGFSPVFIFYSRMAFEANLGLFLTLAIVYLAYFPWVKRLLLNDVLLLITTAVAVLTYNTPFLLLPFLIILIPFRRNFKRPTTWTGAVIGLIVLWIAAAAVLLPLTTQKSGITIFSDPLVYHNYIDYRMGLNSSETALFGSKYVYWAGLILENAVSSFSPSFLILKGGSHPWHQVPGTGHLYIVVAILALVGFVVALGRLVVTVVSRNWKPLLQSTEFLLLYLLFISLLPSVITVDAPHATRSLLFFFMLAAFAVYGLWKTGTWLQQKMPGSRPRVEDLVIGIFSALFLLQAGAYMRTYFTQYPLRQIAFMPGYNFSLPPSSEPLDVIDAEGYQYILTAWYQQLPATEFLSTIQRQPKDTIGFSYPKQVGQTHFWKNITEARENQVRKALMWEPETESWQVYEIQ